MGAHRIGTEIADDDRDRTRLWRPEDFEPEECQEGLEDVLREHDIEVRRKLHPAPTLEGKL